MTREYTFLGLTFGWSILSNGKSLKFRANFNGGCLATNYSDMTDAELEFGTQTEYDPIWTYMMMIDDCLSSSQNINFYNIHQSHHCPNRGSVVSQNQRSGHNL